MADLGGLFDPSTIPEDERSFDVLPVGTYKMQVVDSEVLDNSAGTGQFLKLTIEIVEGEYAGRKVWEQLNIRNPSAQAQQIAQRALADLFFATGTPASRNSDVLHFKPFLGKVTVVKDKNGQYPDKNGVRFNVQQGNPPAGKAAPQRQQQQQRQPQRQQPQQARGNKPWQRGQQQEDPPF
jgi:hypothetical protein